MISNYTNHGVEQNILPRDGLMDLDEPNEERLEQNVSTIVEEEMIAPLGYKCSLATSNDDEDDAQNQVVCMLYYGLYTSLVEISNFKMFPLCCFYFGTIRGILI